ncbi:MAG TPA: hypothetical protein VHC90_02060 [Bryobacteraceae bacterium]|nr:hypothetical protein [Bryobacteraceae bacterium]
MPRSDYAPRALWTQLRNHEAALVQSRQILNDMRECIARTQVAIQLFQDKPESRAPFDWFHGYDDEPEGVAYTTTQSPLEADTPKNSTDC